MKATAEGVLNHDISRGFKGFDAGPRDAGGRRYTPAGVANVPG